MSNGGCVTKVVTRFGKHNLHQSLTSVQSLFDLNGGWHDSCPTNDPGTTGQIHHPAAFSEILQTFRHGPSLQLWRRFTWLKFRTENAQLRDAWGFKVFANAGPPETGPSDPGPAHFVFPGPHSLIPWLQVWQSRDTLRHLLLGSIHCNLPASLTLVAPANLSRACCKAKSTRLQARHLLL